MLGLQIINGSKDNIHGEQSFNY